MTPAEMYKLEQVFDLTDGQIFLTHETTANRPDVKGGQIPRHPKRIFGRAKVETALEFVRRTNKEKLKQNKDCK